MDIQPSLHRYAVAVRAALARILANKDIIGQDNTRGTIYRNIFNGHVGSLSDPSSIVGDFTPPVPAIADDSNVYLHLKLPFNTLSDSKMFWLKVTGYNFGAAKAIDTTFVGYSYVPTNQLLNTQVISQHEAECYRDSNGNIVACIKFSSIYYTTLEVDSMMVGNGTPIRRGMLQARFSKESRVVF